MFSSKSLEGLCSTAGEITSHFNEKTHKNCTAPNGFRRAIVCVTLPQQYCMQIYNLVIFM